MEQMIKGYRFPAMKTDDPPIVHCAKLAEEVGEVCEAVLKQHKTVSDVIDECMDVMQVCETLLRSMYVTDEEFQTYATDHVSKLQERGYYG